MQDVFRATTSGKTNKTAVMWPPLWQSFLPNIYGGNPGIVFKYYSIYNSHLIHRFLLVVNKVGNHVVEAWFDEIIIVGLISSEAMEATEARALQVVAMPAIAPVYYRCWCHCKSTGFKILKADLC